MTPAALFVALLAGAPEAEARSFRVDQVPNAFRYRCQMCHDNPGGGGPRHVFGLDVEANLVGTSTATADVDWATVSQLDSDNDGLTNGEEMGDPDGDGTPIVDAPVTRPWDDTDPGPEEEPDTGDGVVVSDTGTGSGDRSGGCQSGTAPGLAGLLLGLGAVLGRGRRR